MKQDEEEEESKKKKKKMIFPFGKYDLKAYSSLKFNVYVRGKEESLITSLFAERIITRSKQRHTQVMGPWLSVSLYYPGYWPCLIM